MPINQIKSFIKTESFSGFLLTFSLSIAIIISNTNLYGYYQDIVNLPIYFGIGSFKTQVTFLSLVNDGLMSLFFLLIGLEMKYHLVLGEYQEKKKLILPTAAAIGGLVVPAVIYLYFNYNQPTLKGWAIPIATDTAFVLCILSFFGRKISLELKIFVVGLSLIDDVLAVLILAVAYSKTINITALIISILILALLALMNLFKVKKYAYYMLIGALLWGSIVEAGMHGTIAGVILAFFIPVKINNSSVSPLKELEHNLHPLVNYLILPIFAFINAEVPLKMESFSGLISDLSLGIILGLFVGKQIGIFLFSYITVKMKLCSLPNHTSWIKFYAIGVLSGIGFTLSIFIGGLCFTEPAEVNAMRLAVVTASFLSAILGIIILKYEKSCKTLYPK